MPVASVLRPHTARGDRTQLSLSLSLSLSGAVPRERNLVCEGGRLFGEAAGRADEALPYTAAPGPGGPGRPATIDSAALQPPVDVQTPSRSSRSSAAGGDLQ